MFNSIISDYTRNGYDFPKSRMILAKCLARQIPADERLKGLPDGEIVTVWRGTYTDDEEQAGEMKAALSWTTDKAVAVWFADRIRNPNSANGLGAVWQATIARENIIAFTQDRAESEIIQYCDVIDPHIAEIDPLEWNDLLQQRIKDCRKSLGLEK